VQNNAHDVQQMVLLGIFGWLAGRAGFTASPIVLGLILGTIAESGFVRGYLIGNARGEPVAEFFTRPISIGIIAFILLGLLYPYLTARRRARGPTNE